MSNLVNHGGYIFKNPTLIAVREGVKLYLVKIPTGKRSNMWRFVAKEDAETTAGIIGEIYTSKRSALVEKFSVGSNLYGFKKEDFIFN